MCGIAGFIDNNIGQYRPKEILVKMTDVIHKRGPDSSGHELYQYKNSVIGFGHRRLAIIDLSKNGNQPMEFAGRYMIFNGEIYNYKELRQELESLGVDFNTTSDTEVVLKSFIQWGANCVKKFVGMFAFVIYDSTCQKIYGFRDRAGVKPFYYHYYNNTLLFASEIKAFKPFPKFESRINQKALQLYFKYGYIPTPHSIFENTFKLASGHYFIYDFKELTLHKYWSVEEAYNRPLQEKVVEKEVLDDLEKLLIKSFQYRMISDVPVGVFLSGGIDSTIVTTLLQKYSTSKINTFTIGFDYQKANEAPFAKATASFLGTNHHEHTCSARDAMDLILDIPEAFDEPFADSSAIPTMLVSKVASKHVKVVLSADGGDEVFGGYDKYFELDKFYRQFAKIPAFARKQIPSFLNITQTLRLDKRISNFEEKSTFLRQISHKKDLFLNKLEPKYFSEQSIAGIFNLDHFRDCSLEKSGEGFSRDLHYLSKIMGVDYKTYMLDDILVKVDRATMYYSIEGREPLLDHNILEYTATLPVDLKIKNKTSKYLLKEILYRHLPQEMVNRPKKGFGIPLTQWMKNDFKDLVYDTINEKALERANIVNPQRLLEIRNDFYNSKNIKARNIWLILCYLLWEKNWFSNE